MMDAPSIEDEVYHLALFPGSKDPLAGDVRSTSHMHHQVPDEILFAVFEGPKVLHHPVQHL